MDADTRFKVTYLLFQSIRDEYKAMFPERKWDPQFFNFFYPFVEHRPYVVFSWNIEGLDELVARFEYPWDKNKSGLFNYLKDNCESPERFKWVNADFEFVGRREEGDPRFGRVFIKYSVTKVDYEVLMSNSTYRNKVIEIAVLAMKVLENALWEHVVSYFHTYPE